MLKLQKKKVPLIFKITLPVFLFTVLLYILSEISVKIADFLNFTVCAVFRQAMGMLFDFLPFSVFECLVIAILPILALLIFLAVRAFKSGNGTRYLLTLLSIVFIIGAEYILALSISYNTTPVYEKMEIEMVEIDEDSLAKTLSILVEEVNTLSGKVDYKDGTSHFDADSGVLGAKITDALSRLNSRGAGLNSFKTRPKMIYFNKAMSYLSLLGIYTFYTGEANVNSLYPDYDVVFSSAHEMAHQRGVLRENEANFVAYASLSASEDAYLRYSAALSMTEYIGNALYRTDKERYYEIIAPLCEGARADINASNRVYREYSDTILSDISEFFNDLFLKSNGTEGVVSYGMVVRIAVSYILSEN